MEYLIGCSGWSYKHWRDNFYPQGLAQSKWLAHYATVFDTVELNASFYRLPTEESVKAWRDRTPSGFKFSVKASRLITHYRRLANCKDELERFIERISPLKDRLGPILYQLPANFERDDERLRRFLGLLPRSLTHVFEFRHDSWWQEEVWDVLRDHQAVFCLFNMGRTNTPIVSTSSQTYIRFHGPETNYASGYSDDSLADWVAKVERLPRVGRAWVYFNNDVGGHAPRDARRLRQIAPNT